MRGNKVKKVLMIIFLFLIIVGLSIFTYLCVYFNTHELFCSRINGVFYEAYSFEFNILKKIKKVSKQVINEYNDKEYAIKVYEEAIQNGEDAKLDNKKVIFNFKDIEFEFSEDLEESKKTCESWGYYCEMVRK